MIIDSKAISINSRPYIIAEISANHNGSLETAKNLILKAKQGGADAVKLQTYTADTLTIQSEKPDFKISGGLWDGRTLYDLYEQAHTPWNWHAALFEEAKKVGISIFSSPFDKSSVDLLDSLDVAAFKIASFEIIDHELISYAASKGRPMILSTGLANLEEIREAVQIVRSSSKEIEFALLHCLSAYPAPAEEYKLGTIQELAREFKVEVGLSDHTIGNWVAASAVSLGATIVEKHFTENSEGDGPDDSFSMNQQGLIELREGLDTVWSARGFDDFQPQPSEFENLRFRRSLYFVRDVLKGQIIGPNDVRSIRPGYGLPPKFKNDVIGKTATENIELGTPVSIELYK